MRSGSALAAALGTLAVLAGSPSSSAHVIHFAAADHSASFVARQSSLRPGSKGIEVTITSPHSLHRGPLRYPGGYKQKRLAATIFLYNTRRDFFGAGLALNAGGGASCVTRHWHDVCRTALGIGFLDYRRHHWKRLKVTLYKPARQAATVRVVIRTR
jgi:hypothetical protein